MQGLPGEILHDGDSVRHQLHASGGEHSSVAQGIVPVRGRVMEPTPDPVTIKAAAEIREYWLHRGFQVDVRIVRMDSAAEKPGSQHQHGPVWCIRTSS
jgi:hypothetical protein